MDPMDPFRNPPGDTMAAARLHVQALTDCGLSREALLRALLEDYPDQGLVFANEDGGDDRSFVSAPSTFGGASDHGLRLSLSTASSRSSARASVLSTSTAASMASSLSSVTSPTQHLASHPSLPSQAPMKSNIIRSPSTTRAYWCSFCDTKFQRKFDWKRHEDEFHERYKKYPCPSCNRVFWGANTFNQHHRQAHGCTTCPHADRVVQYTKRKTAWACGFCAAFLPTRDRYFDHVAHHYEAGGTKAHWSHSNTIYGLLHQATLHHAWKELIGMLYGHLPRDQQPMFEWDMEATGHQQGFLENESPGKLQDLLEFFDEARDEPRFLAKLAHDQARIVCRQDLAMATNGLTNKRPVSEMPQQIRGVSRKPSMKHLSAPVRSRSSAMRLHEQFNAMALPLGLQPPPPSHTHIPEPQRQPPPPPQQHQQQPPPPPPQQHPMSPHAMPHPQQPPPPPPGPAQHQSPVVSELPSDAQQLNFSGPPPPLSHTSMLYQQPIVEGTQADFFNLTSTANLSSSTLHHGLYEDWSSFTTTIVDEQFHMSGGWEHGLPAQNHGPNHIQNHGQGHSMGG
ncbi:hypothetical protein GQ53DRAFT_399715 [Thozetella sp. PMI_491]|nr:hypothetical protein GQ53DRAFT_399715 [Thozetella sp. PMI_491]